MQATTWNNLPIWALLASRDILKAAIPERRLSDTLKSILGVLTSLPQLDLSDMAAIYIRDAGQDRQRLFHNNTADQMELPLDLPSGARMPECIAEREDLAGFIAGAQEHKGSWWPHWAIWLREQDPREVPTRGKRKPGGKGGGKRLEDAPGSYVRMR